MKPYIFKYRELDPRLLRPIGDRYLVEVLETDERSPSGLMLPERTEQERGWTIGVVFSVGNGHRLEVPDPAVVMPEGYIPQEGLSDEQQMQRRVSALSYYTPMMGDHSTLQRVPAMVPMFFAPGEVIFIEKYSGREFHIAERTFRFVSQVDCLGTSGRRLVLQEDGGWEDAPEPQAEAPTNGALRIHVPKPNTRPPHRRLLRG
jgi:co-chaperonin GroES (HSP10)